MCLYNEQIYIEDIYKHPVAGLSTTMSYRCSICAPNSAKRREWLAPKCQSIGPIRPASWEMLPLHSIPWPGTLLNETFLVIVHRYSKRLFKFVRQELVYGEPATGPGRVVVLIK